jgi:predicted cupin superfamily sugar epimerase
MDDRTAAEVVAEHSLAPHPEGGWFRETYRAAARTTERPASTAILFLLGAGEHSHWHRVDADEHWLFHAGDPLDLRIVVAGTSRDVVLGNGPGMSPQAVVPAGAWQAAWPAGRWSLVGCVVAPGFDFAGFELAEPGWAPLIEDDLPHE